MRDQALFDKIDLHLIRVLHTVLTERSVSRAALRLGMHQPAVSGALRRLRELAGDPLLVRSGAGMQPTDAALAMVEPAASILRAAEALFSDARGFEPRSARRAFRIAASAYLDPLFLPRLVAHLRAEAPACTVEVLPLSANAHYQAHLAQGEADVVIANWPEPPGELHQSRLFADEVVCLVAREHPALRRGWQLQEWLAAEHIAPTPTHPGARGVIDAHLDGLGLARNITVRCAHFSLIPAMVAGGLLVLTTGRQFCERYAQVLPLAVLPPPLDFPRLVYYQLWHPRAHPSAAGAWLREAIRHVALSLRKP
ncbi:LysR family transcriptional regulator [Melaminivora sp.]|uniref:LysR family transcriptional regulator n=1 Tax=Melaminivora sp. TaxID=1933032 RepID=UPI0028A8D3DD|nr:LysR family transcriptional regulator [Melaminivora sp.]